MHLWNLKGSDEVTEKLEWPHEEVHERSDKPVGQPIKDDHGPVEKPEESKVVPACVPDPDPPVVEPVKPIVDPVEAVSLEELLQWSPEDHVKGPDVPDELDVMGMGWSSSNILHFLYTKNK